MVHKIDVAELVAHGQRLAAEVRTWSDRKLRMCYAQERTLAERTVPRVPGAQAALVKPAPAGRRPAAGHADG